MKENIKFLISIFPFCVIIFVGMWFSWSLKFAFLFIVALAILLEKQDKSAEINPDEIIEECHQDNAGHIIDIVTEQEKPSEWSGEDEKIMSIIMEEGELKPSERHWLKSLKERVRPKQGGQTSLQTNERAWLYLVSDVLTWKDGIGQYLDDPRVQELAKKLRSDYRQKLYKSTVS